MPYKYDIFLSYRRSPVRDQWIIEHFIPLFWERAREEIAGETGRAPSGLFFDQTELSDETRKGTLQQHGIEPGENWQNELREAIKASRCMVALWSPLYFHSEWCQIEWKSFAGRRINPVHPTLLVPISVFDGDRFPSAARAAQYFNLSDFVLVGEGFKKTELYITFQQELRNLARRVARVISSAPEWEDWPLPETVQTPGEVIIQQEKL